MQPKINPLHLALFDVSEEELREEQIAMALLWREDAPLSSSQRELVERVVSRSWLRVIAVGGDPRVPPWNRLSLRAVRKLCETIVYLQFCGIETQFTALRSGKKRGQPFAKSEEERRALAEKIRGSEIPLWQWAQKTDLSEKTLQRYQKEFIPE